MTGKAPLRIQLLGGPAQTADGIIRLSNDDLSAEIINVWDIDHIDLSKPEDMYCMMRSVHNQYVRLLTYRIPYETDDFLRLTPSGSYQEISDLVGWGKSQRGDNYKIHPNSLSLGIWALYGMESPQHDFREMVSIILCTAPLELEKTLTQISSGELTNGDKLAPGVLSSLEGKLAFVRAYFKTKLGFRLTKLQYETAGALLQDQTKEDTEEE